jgi:arginyl-tRNA synthetase
VISSDVRHAIARAIADEGLGPADPGLRPTATPGQYASSVAFASGEQPRPLAARVAARLEGAGDIARAEVTGPGFITVTVTPEALAALPGRIVAAGVACATSATLRGVLMPAPPAGDPLAEVSWEKARAALAAQLTARLAAAAGATAALPEDVERTVSSPPPEQLAPGGGATVRYAAKTAEPAPSRPPRETGGYGGFPPGMGPDSGPAGWRSLPSGENPVARAVAYAGADAVRFSLARAVPGRPVEIDRQLIARHVLGNPAYAVRYAHARAASGVRWAANSRPTTLGRPAVPRHPLAHQAELVLLDALSWLPERVAMAARRGRPDEFARYLEELASATVAALICVGYPANARVPGTDRLSMAEAARTGLAAGLGLLGVGAPDRL